MTCSQLIYSTVKSGVYQQNNYGCLIIISTELLTICIKGLKKNSKDTNVLYKKTSF